jgi:hypothetical protein
VQLQLKSEEPKMIIKRIALAFCLLAALSAAVVAQTSQGSMNASMTSATAQEKKTLYARLGGYDAIAAVVDDFITRLATDKRFEKFFVGFQQRLEKEAAPAHSGSVLCGGGRALCIHGPRHENVARRSRNYRG